MAENKARDYVQTQQQGGLSYFPGLNRDYFEQRIESCDVRE